MAYYIPGRAGESFVNATVHRRRDCPDGPTRPLAESTIEQTKGITFCPDCAGGSPDDICTVELSSGGECGRDKPCPYHD